MAGAPPLGASRRSVLLASALALGGASVLAGCTAERAEDEPGTATGRGGVPGAEDGEALGAAGATRFVYELVALQGLSPLAAARVFAGTMLAVQRGAALLAGVQPLLDRVRTAGEGDGLPPVDDVDEAGLTSAVLTAVVPLLVPSLGPGAWQLVSDRRAADLAQRAAVGVPQSRLDRTAALGQALAVDVARWASGDGTAAAAARPYEAPTGAGLWRPTPPGNLPPADPNADLLRPILSSSGRSLPEVPALVFSTEAGSPFRSAAEEVYEISRALTPEQVEVAQHWSDDRGQTGTPVGHWMLLAAEGCEARESSEGAALAILATTAVAMNDAMRECFVRKYQSNTIRPISYINDVIDPAWTSLITTPPFPEHPSGHSVVSSAAVAVLEDQLAPEPLTDRVRSPRVAYQEPREFETFTAAAQEAGVSRVYGGIHYRYATEAGAELGTAVGKNTVAALLP